MIKQNSIIVITSKDYLFCKNKKDLQSCLLFLGEKPFWVKKDQTITELLTSIYRKIKLFKLEMISVCLIIFGEMLDTYKHKGMRRQLIEELKEKGISNPDVLAAFDKVPRHFFLDSSFTNQAYSNIAFQIGAGQTISHPFTVALQTSLLELEKGHKVLEIGTGSGFQTCILCAMGAKVVSIERQKELFINAKDSIEKLGYTARLFYGDGYKGKASYAPYDSILVTCGAPFIPEDLKKQLKIGGKLVIPIGEGKNQIMHRLTKISDEEWETETYGVFSFVPMLEKTNK